MVVVDGTSCKVAVFVCTNERPPEKVCCSKVGGMDFYQALKSRVRERGLVNTHWISRSGCLGFCNEVGTTIVIFKQGQNPVWYNQITQENFESIWSEIE